MGSSPAVEQGKVTFTHTDPGGTVVVVRGVPALIAKRDEGAEEHAFTCSGATRLQRMVRAALALPGPNDVVDVDFRSGRMRFFACDADEPTTTARYAYRCPHGASGPMHRDGGHEFTADFAIGTEPAAMRCVGHRALAPLVGGPFPIPVANALEGPELEPTLFQDPAAEDPSAT